RYGRQPGPPGGSDLVRSRHDAALARVAGDGADGVSAIIPESDTAAGRQCAGDGRRYDDRSRRSLEGWLPRGKQIADPEDMDDDALDVDATPLSLGRSALAGCNRAGRGRRAAEWAFAAGSGG